MQNTGIKIIKKSIEIKAPKEKVWEVLVLDTFNCIWFAEFSPGTHALTDWEVGSKVIYTDQSNSGLIGSILVNRVGEVLSIEYTGVLENDQEIYDSEMALALKGSRETYRLTENQGHVLLAIESDMAETYFDMMSAAWDKALAKIKELAETGA